MGVDVLRINTTGMRCPLPVLTLVNQTVKTPKGTIVEVTGDCPTLEPDIREFCRKRKLPVVAVRGTFPLLTIVLRF